MYIQAVPIFSHANFRISRKLAFEDRSPTCFVAIGNNLIMDSARLKTQPGYIHERSRLLLVGRPWQQP